MEPLEPPPPPPPKSATGACKIVVSVEKGG